jgi:hypothetical protein
MSIKRAQNLFGAGAIFGRAGDVDLIAAIGQRHIKRLLNARQMLAVLAIKLGQQSVIVEFKNQRLANRAAIVFVRTAQPRAPVFVNLIESIIA